MWVTARAVEATEASPGFGDGIGLPSVRSIAFGGSVGDWCHVRNVREPAPGEREEGLERGLVAAEKADRLARLRGRSGRGTDGRRPRRRPFRRGRSRRPPRARPTARSAAPCRPAGRGPCSARRSTCPRGRLGFVAGWSTSARNARRQWRFSSYSWRRATPRRSLQSKPANRCSVRAISLASLAPPAAPVNGAASDRTLSRAGTLTFQSPPSSASAQTSVAGSVGRHSKSRGPVGTPAIGTRSARGRLASVRVSCLRDPRPPRRARSSRTS